MISTRILVTAAAAVFLGACGAEDDTWLRIEMGAAPVPLDPDTAEVAEEVWLLYEDLATRLRERGVTLEELQAAVDANDDAALGEMFGFTDEEVEALSTRFLYIAELARAERGDDPGDGVAKPEGWPNCDTKSALACVSLAAVGLAPSARQFPLYAGGALVVSGLICAGWYCLIDPADPGPPVRPQ